MQLILIHAPPVSGGLLHIRDGIHIGMNIRGLVDPLTGLPRVTLDYLRKTLANRF